MINDPRHPQVVMISDREETFEGCPILYVPVGTVRNAIESHISIQIFEMSYLMLLIFQHTLELSSSVCRRLRMVLRLHISWEQVLYVVVYPFVIVEMPLSYDHFAI